MGHASALTLRVDLLVPSRDLNSVVNSVYSLVLLGAVRLEPKWHRYRAICVGSAWAASGFSWYYLS